MLNTRLDNGIVRNHSKSRKTLDAIGQCEHFEKAYALVSSNEFVDPVRFLRSRSQCAIHEVSQILEVKANLQMNAARRLPESPVQFLFSFASSRSD